MGFFWATDDKITEWRKRGDSQGDPFDLRVALVLANRNFERAKGPLKGSALINLGHCRLSIGKRREDNKLLISAEKAYRAAIKAFPKTREPVNWSVTQDGLGCALKAIAERAADPEKMREAITAHRAGLALTNKTRNPESWGMSQNNLGTALQKLGEIEQDEASLRAALDAHKVAIRARDPIMTPELWANSQNNLGVTYRWIGTVTSDIVQFDIALKFYESCLTVKTRSDSSFTWAATQWNIADLAFARYTLDPNPELLTTAENHALAARDVFSEASDHHTARCDDLLAQIKAAAKDS